MKYFWIAALIFLGGCTTQPHIVEYRIVPNLEIQASSNSQCKGKSLKIAPVFTSSSLMSQTMKYTTEEFKEFAFTESEWAVTPNRAIGNALERALREKKIFASVSSFRSRSRADLLLESSVDEFIQHFYSNNKKSSVKVSLFANLVDNKNSKSLASKTFTKELAVEQLNAKAGVEALNKALKEVLQEELQWLEQQQCQ